MVNEQLSNSTIFPLGQKVEANFSGDAYLQMIFTDPQPLNTSIGNVTFAPGGRNNWHTHKVGQVLLVTGGEDGIKKKENQLNYLKWGMS